MSDVVLCPNCGGQKTVSKPPYIAGDVNSWVCSSISMYPCPTCDGQGWIRVDDVPHHDFDCIKYIALSSMETAENLMDECTKRADRIKELEAELERTEGDVRVIKEMRDEVLGDWELKRGAVEILEDEVNELTNENKRLGAYHDRVRDTHQAREVVFAETCERYETDLELLNDILEIVNPLVKSGAYAKPIGESRTLALKMGGLCRTVIRFRRNHNIVG